MATCTDGGEDLSQAVVCIDPVDLRPRHHDVADVEDTLDHFLLRPLQQPRFPAGGHQQLQLLGGMQRLLARTGLQAAQPQTRLPRPLSTATRA